MHEMMPLYFANTSDSLSGVDVTRVNVTTVKDLESARKFYGHPEVLPKCRHSKFDLQLIIHQDLYILKLNLVIHLTLSTVIIVTSKVLEIYYMPRGI